MNSTTEAPLDGCDWYDSSETGEVDVWGLVVVIIFYIAVLAVGIFATYRAKSWKQENSEDMMVAGRNIGLCVGIFTMSATWVGGGYINGVAENIYNPAYGLAWCQPPVAYFISGIIAGLFFAKPMRAAGYVTMLDPFQIKYGKVMTSLLYLPALTGDIFWTAAILSALGATLAVIVGLAHKWAVIISACVSVLYTLVGGLYSVAYTDVIQLICIFLGLYISFPFAMTHEDVPSISETSHTWVGSLPTDRYVGFYVDGALLLIFGGIPWQVFFQRVLSQKTPERARLLSFFSTAGCLFMAVPSIILGAVGSTYLTPPVVSVVGLAAVCAAVMSSADSTILSSSSMFARNVYKPLRDAIGQCCGKEKESSEKELLWVMRFTIFAIGAAATAMAINVSSIYALWFLCADLVYVILFPQLVCVMFIPFTNTYGSAVGYVVGLFFRLSGGESYLDFPALIKYPLYDDENNVQCFPFKTMSMLLSLLTIITVSLLTRALFYSGCLPPEADIAQALKSPDMYSPQEEELKNRGYVEDDPVDLKKF